MKQLCVFDLDGTLIPYDSFGRITRKLMARHPALAARAVMRRLGLLSRSAFAEAAHEAALPLFADAEALRRIADGIAGDVPNERAALIDAWRRRGGHLVLLSASPDDYVGELAARLGFDEAFGSSWVGGVYRHLHGPEKRRFVDERFPPDEWARAFAIADQPSDEPLLAAFREVVRVAAVQAGRKAL